MSYGTIKSSEGVDLSTDGLKQIQVGQCVEGNTITSLEMAEDQNGNVNEKRAVLTITQSNGAKFSHSLFDSEEAWGQDQVKKELLHICTKIVTKAEYEVIISGVTSFLSFITAIKDSIIPLAEGKLFNMKIVYKKSGNGKWYPSFPKFPSFVELAGTTPSTLTTNPIYDFYQQPVPTEMPTVTATSADIF